MLLNSGPCVGLWAVYSCLAITAASEPQQTTTERAELVLPCLEQIIATSFYNSKHIALIWNQQWNFPGTVSASIPRTFLTSKEAILRTPVQNHVTDLFLIFGIDTIHEIVSALPRAPRIAIILTLIYATDDELQSALDDFWLFNFVNVVILTVNETDMIEAYSYIPYQSCSSPRKILIDTWLSNSGWLGLAKLFPRNKIVNANKCAIYCSTIHDPYSVIMNGSEVTGVTTNLLLFISETINFTSLIKNVSDDFAWGSIHSNGSGNGLRGDVFFNRAEIAFGDFLPFAETVHLEDYTRPIKSACLTIALPAGMGGIPHGWDTVYREFSIVVWTGVILAWFIMFIAVLIMANTFRLFHIENRGEAFLFVTALLLAIPVHRMPESPSARVLTSAMICFSLIMCTAYIAALRMLLEDPASATDVTSVQDLLRLNLSIAWDMTTLENLLRFLSTNQTIKTLAERSVPLTDAAEIVKSVALNRTWAIVELESLLSFLASDYDEVHSGPSVFVFRHNCIYSFMGAPFILRKGSMLTDQVNTVIQRAIEGGFPNLWIQHFARRRRYIKGTVLALNKFSLIGVFQVLIVGLGVSIVVFILEFCTHYKYHKTCFRE